MLADQSDTCLKALSAPDIDESGFPWPARGLLHEIHADATALAAAMGFALGAIDRAGGKPIVLARCPRRAVMRVQLYGEGLQALGVDPRPLVVAVMFGASAAFATPIGYQTNTLVYGPGGYKFSDYWRMGLPLEVLVVAVSIPAILLFWPL